MREFEPRIIVRGGGDLATGIIHKLTRAGFQILILECEHPAAIRRQVSFCEAVFSKTQTVEGLTAECIGSVSDFSGKNQLEEQVLDCFRRERIPLLVDPEGRSIELLQPDILVDSIMAKRNLGTNMDQAALTIGVGPGFTAGVDVHAVIETQRGHNLGRVITAGPAASDSGVPGSICGYSKERVMHAPAGGSFHLRAEIGDLVEKGQIIGEILTEDRNAEPVPVYASLTGLLRGILRDGYPVYKGMKTADIDPRKEELINCFTISDKSRSIGGGALELVSAFIRKKNLRQLQS